MLPRVVLIVVCAFLWNVRDSTEAGFVKKIVGGLATEINKAPYQVSLELKNKGVFRHICGGSIVNKDWIVTAAHCLVVVPKAKYRIRAGSTLLQNGGTLHSIRKYIKHVDFDEDTNDYDVAVMRVSPPFEFSDTIKAIELASAEPHFGKTALVTGWGHTSYNGSLSSHLKMIHLVITNKGVCNAIYQWSITSRMICASDGKNGRDSCTGDSGGPLTIDNKLVGIVSFGKGCARKGFPGVYTNVFVLRPWIENSIGTW